MTTTQPKPETISKDKSNTSPKRSLLASTGLVPHHPSYPPEKNQIAFLDY
ncbi:MAG: hypothetical protein ACEQSC_00040 [Candidatus Nanopelagicaceae bacterium]